MRKYDTGAHRDSRKGKGRYDLISPHMLDRLAKRLEHGSEIYGDRNWEKGIPMDDFYDSAMRHLTNWKKGLVNEDHLAAALFNIMGMIHFDTVGYPEEETNVGKDLGYKAWTCRVCKKGTNLVDSLQQCSRCRVLSDEYSVESVPQTSFGETITPRPSVSPSKLLEEAGKVSAPISSKDRLGAHTEAVTYYHPDQQLVIQGLAKYD